MTTPLILPDSSTAVGVSLLTIRKRLARTLGYYAEGTVTTEASSLEAERYLISTTLRSDSLPPDHWDSLFLYVRDGAQGGVQRKIWAGGFEGTAAAIQVDYPYDATLDVGTAFEISVLPTVAWQGMNGLNDIINEGLELLPVEDMVSITVTDDDDDVLDTEYSLAGYSWPVKRVLDVYYPRTSTAHERRRAMNRGSWTFENDGESPVLSFNAGAPGNLGESFEVKLHRPATTRIRQSGTWGNSTTGLSSDSDQCLYDALTVVNMARPIALKRMALMFPPGSKERDGLLGEAQAADWTASVARFHNQFRGNGAQKVGFRGSR